MIFYCAKLQSFQLFSFVVKGSRVHTPFYFYNSVVSKRNVHNLANSQDLPSEKPWIYTQPKGFQPGPSGGGYMEEVELHIDTLTNLGAGLGRLNGRVVMVPHTIPGELVRVGLHHNYNNYSEGSLIAVLSPSPERVEPLCKYYGICGGCQYQHMSIDLQRHWKKIQVQEVLQKLGNITFPTNEVFGTPEVYGYRSKLTPHYDVPREGKDIPIGFKRLPVPTIYFLLKRGVDLWTLPRDSLVDVDECIIATEEINKRYRTLREEMLYVLRRQLSGELLPIVKKKKRSRRARKAGDRPLGATLLLRHALDGVETDFNTLVNEEVKGVRFEFKAGEFFQNNPHVLPHMVQHVVENAQAEGITHLIDTYCGGGLFCLSASKYFQECAGIEVSDGAIASAKRNAEINRIQNCCFLSGTAEEIFKNVDFPSRNTAIIIDPPRKGCDQQFLEQLFNFKPARIVYVSCDPATQARDSKKIIQAGYRIIDIQPFDLFPQTRHIENVITFMFDELTK